MESVFDVVVFVVVVALILSSSFTPLRSWSESTLPRKSGSSITAISFRVEEKEEEKTIVGRWINIRRANRFGGRLREFYAVSFRNGQQLSCTITQSNPECQRR